MLGAWVGTRVVGALVLGAWIGTRVVGALVLGAWVGPTGAQVIAQHTAAHVSM